MEPRYPYDLRPEYFPWNRLTRCCLSFGLAIRLVYSRVIGFAEPPDPKGRYPPYRRARRWRGQISPSMRYTVIVTKAAAIRTPQIRARSLPVNWFFSPIRFRCSEDTGGLNAKHQPRT